MDNVTHSLAGLLIAEATTQLHERRTGVVWPARFRTAVAGTSMFAANVLDADLLYAGTGGGLGYLLHHRGHTHTVPAILAGAVLVWGTFALLWRWLAKAPVSAHDGRWLAGLLLASVASHLLLDWTNSYGVHPFWPFDDRWYYGDSVFIVEPWLWVVAVPTLVLASQRSVPRVLLSVVLALGLVLAARVSMVSRGAFVVLLTGAVVSILVTVGLRRRPGARATVAVSGWLLATLTFATGTRVARAAVVESVRAATPTSELLDVVTSAMPANAVCVFAITVERVGPTYRVTTATASAAPAITPASQCPENGSAADMPATSARRSTAAVQWGGEWQAPVSELARIARESCTALAALRFIRVPVWRLLDDSTLVIGDARYGGTGPGGFTRIVAPLRSAACPRAIPPWVPPRSDLLDM